MTKVLITGATGNVGLEVIRALQKIGHQLDLYAGVRDLRNVAKISSSFRREDFFSGQGARRERSLSYVTDEATKSDGKSRRPNREVIFATFLKTIN